MTLAAGYLKEAQAFGAQVVRKTFAFDNTGAGAETLFTVTGSVAVLVVGVCTESVTSAGGGTLEVGVVGATAALIAQTVAATITNGMVWIDNVPANIEVMASFGGAYIAGGTDIDLTVGGFQVEDGTIVFNCFWTPLTDDANVVAA